MVRGARRDVIADIVTDGVSDSSLDVLRDLSATTRSRMNIYSVRKILGGNNPLFLSNPRGLLHQG